jgi:hypothetical protein
MDADEHLPSIPVFDVGPDFAMEIGLLIGERGYELLEAATRGVPRIALRALDRAARAWLVHNKSAYLAEIDALAARSRLPGLYYLNVAYEFGCTTAARPSEADGRPVLQRVLDWEFPGIGRSVVAARIACPLGHWIALGWPAFTGVVQGMAPGRFAAAIDQPMPARRLGIMAIDRLIDKRGVVGSTEIQPIHLLRRVFETAPDFAAAREMLVSVPVSTPSIFILAGIRRDEALVIERRGAQARLIGEAIAANEWRAEDWRRGHHKAFENDRRLTAMRAVSTRWDAALSWATWPLVNDSSRLVMMAEPAGGRLVARGYEAGRPATRILSL